MRKLITSIVVPQLGDEGRREERRRAKGREERKMAKLCVCVSGGWGVFSFLPF